MYTHTFFWRRDDATCACVCVCHWVGEIEIDEVDKDLSSHTRANMCGNVFKAIPLIFGDFACFSNASFTVCCDWKHISSECRLIQYIFLWYVYILYTTIRFPRKYTVFLVLHIYIRKYDMSYFMTMRARGVYWRNKNSFPRRFLVYICIICILFLCFEIELWIMTVCLSECCVKC